MFGIPLPALFGFGMIIAGTILAIFTMTQISRERRRERRTYDSTR